MNQSPSHIPHRIPKSIKAYGATSNYHTSLVVPKGYYSDKKIN